MVRSILALLFCAVGFNAFAEQNELVLGGLLRVDKFGCNVEALGKTQIRVLSTGQNVKPGRYLDLNLEDKEMKFEKTADGWTLTKDVDLGERAIAPLFPKALYGHEITKLKYSVDGKGDATLKVFFNPSSMAIGGYVTDFVCQGTEMIHLNKKNVCPNCLSSLGDPDQN
jgi:hypothetical protein